MSSETRLVVKDNALIEASFNLSLVEQRLMLLAIVEAREIDKLTPETPIEVKATAYRDQYGVVGNEAYIALKEAGKTLKRKEFTYLDKYKGDDIYSTVNWVNKISYAQNKGMIVLYMSSEVISMISRLEAQFTRYHLNKVSKFKSKYSIRLYELVVKWLSIGKSDIYEVNKLRSLLGVENTEYKTMSLFKVNVLDKAVKEIKDKSNHIDVSYIQLKEGRNIVGFIFKVKEKGNTNKPIDIGFKGMSMPQAIMFSDKLSRDTAFQNHYKAHVGESTEDYADRIAVLLSQEFYVKEWMQYLESVGYVPRNK